APRLPVAAGRRQLGGVAAVSHGATERVQLGVRRAVGKLADDLAGPTMLALDAPAQRSRAGETWVFDGALDAVQRADVPRLREVCEQLRLGTGTTRMQRLEHVGRPHPLGLGQTGPVVLDL